MKAEKLFEIIGSEFYTGVPDSQLKALCNFLMSKYGIDKQHHLIAANEGNCLALAAGYHLATSKIPVVYMQNSGEGNIINPLASLVNDKVYAIPVVFIIGWRGEPGIHDEPQHIYQGIVTEKLMNDMDVSTFAIGGDTSDEEVSEAMSRFRSLLEVGKQVAFIIRKGALEYDGKVKYSNEYLLNREEVIRHIANTAGDDPVISTTGKISRELFEARTAWGQGHERDFLTVGSMGHASQIALGIALEKTDRRVWCFDGDGATIMHMGSMAIVASKKPANYIHVVFNNGAHDSVGGQPTVGLAIDLPAVAKALGYSAAFSVSTIQELKSQLSILNSKFSEGPVLIEVKVKKGNRKDLGRPTTTPIENRDALMQFLKK